MKLFSSIWRAPDLRCYLLIVAAALIAYWPLSFHVFTLKNDALSYFLPFRYHVSTAIREGHFPFWSPYLYTGLPLHADIQSGVWNPVVMIVSLFTVYDMSVLQAETVFYLALGGIGFYKLCRAFNLDYSIAFSLAVCYLCSGFMIDSCAFVPWITSAAYLPFVLYYFQGLMHAPSLAAALKLAVSHALLFLAGYLSFFIVASYLLLFMAAAQLIACWRRHRKTEMLILMKRWTLAGAAMLLLVSPALLSYLEFLPFYARGAGAGIGAAQHNPFRLVNSLSYLLPQSYRLYDEGNDISARNAFVGIIPFLFLLYSFRRRFTAQQRWIALLTLIFFLFSLGAATPVRAFFYHALPLMNSFRHPGTMRLFTTVGLLLLAGFGWKQFKEDANLYALRPIIAFVMIVIAGIVAVLVMRKDGLIFPGWNGLTAETVKQWMENEHALSCLVVSGIAQLLFLAVLLLKPSGRSAVVLSLLNMLVMTTLSMPFTSVSQHRVREVNAFVHNSAPGHPPGLALLPVEDRINDASQLTDLGYLPFYRKRIEIQDQLVTPTVNSAYGNLLRDTALRRELVRHPFFYLKSGAPVSLRRFSPNSFSFELTTAAEDTLYITQQYNPHWKAYVNGDPASIDSRGHALMQLAVPAGRNEIRLSYEAPLVKAAAFISLIVLAASLIFVFYRKWKR